MDRGWEGLFADLEAQFDSALRRELDAEIADRTRRERAQIELLERLAAHCGSRLSLRLSTGTSIAGTLSDLGEGWLLMDEGRRSHFVPLAAVMSYEGVGSRVDSAKHARRFGVGYALRGIARDRSAVVITDRSGLLHTGTIDGVGADHLDLAEHLLDEVRRAQNVRTRRVLPFSAIVSVSRA